MDDKLLFSTHCYVEKTLGNHSKSIQSIALGIALRQEDQIQTLKHLETKLRVQKILVAKMLRLERKQILGGPFLFGPKEQRGFM